MNREEMKDRRPADLMREANEILAIVVSSARTARSSNDA